MKEKIKDIRNALSHGCYLSALSLALTIPDICGRIYYTEERGKKVYIDWFNNFIYPYYLYNGKYAEHYEGTEFNGEACYALRCAYLHEGNADLQEQNQKLKINNFEFSLSTLDYDYGVDMHGVTWSNFSNEKTYKVRLDIRKLCSIMCDVAEKFYEENENKELFVNHRIHIVNLMQKG